MKIAFNFRERNGPSIDSGCAAKTMSCKGYRKSNERKSDESFLYSPVDGTASLRLAASTQVMWITDQLVHTLVQTLVQMKVYGVITLIV